MINLLASSIIRKVAAALVASVALVATAGAEPVPMVDTSYTVGMAGGVSVNRLDIAGPGILTVTLADIPWPQSLSQVGMLLASANGSVIGHFSGFESESFKVSGTATLYAFCFGQAGAFKDLDFGFGTYGLRIEFQPTAVPLPAGGMLLAAGLLVLAVLARARRRSSHRAEPRYDYWVFPETAIKL